MTAAEYRKLMKLPPPGYHENQTRARIPTAKHAQQAPALEADDAREAHGPGRPVVRFVLCRVQLLDADAKYGCIKDLLDGLQYAGLIRGDREDQINLVVDQQRVAHYAEERTEIEIEWPDISTQTTNANQT
jgi:hypothetical protein